MLDLGQYSELDKYNNKELLAKINNKFEIINLNERVEKYLKNRFSIDTLEELYNIFHSKMVIVTRGKNGADFIFDNSKITKELSIKSDEIDPTGAGDAFFSVFIYEYAKNGGVINGDFIDLAFDKATKLTNKVVKSFGARGHIQKLYKIKKVNDECVCQNFEIITRKQMKRCNININNLEKRIINAINSNAYDKFSKIKFQDLNNIIFAGTGGSFAGAKFSAKVINQLYGTNAIALYPRDLYYRNNQKVDKLFLFTYSGTTNDLLVSSKSIDNKNKYIITKGELQKVVMKTGISKNNVITYRSGTNKGKERGFLSFEGALVPATLFLELYFQNNSNHLNVINFVHDSISYWKNYFLNFFNNNKKELKKIFKVGNNLNIFAGDFTESAGIDFESKIIESGIFNCIVHEKKNFSHGRFVNYEHLNKGKNIYFKQKTTGLYERKLLDYLQNDDCLIIESRFDGILCEYDLLVASQYLIYFISNFLNMDISKPTYSEDAMKIYFYKGEL